jgi:hypothetical protein
MASTLAQPLGIALVSLADLIQQLNLPSGKHTKSYGKSPCLISKSTISMAIFNSKLLVYQRVSLVWLVLNPSKLPENISSSKCMASCSESGLNKWKNMLINVDHINQYQYSSNKMNQLLVVLNPRFWRYEDTLMFWYRYICIHSSPLQSKKWLDWPCCTMFYHGFRGGVFSWIVGSFPLCHAVHHD